MSIVRHEQQPPRDWIALLPATAELAQAVQHTNFVPKELRGDAAAITACVMYGDEVGLKPMQSLAHIYIVNGRPELSSRAARGLILGAGHELWIEEGAGAARVTVGGRRRDSNQITRVTWTIQQAEGAGLTGKDTWRKYPRAMLANRAFAELARMVFADAIGGLDIAEDIEETTEEPTVATRRRRRALAPVSAPTETAAEPGPATAPAGSDETPDGPSDPSAAVPPEERLLTSEDEDVGRLRRKLMASFRERGFNEREARLAFARFVVGRSVESSNELTVGEASRLIDALEQGHTLAEE